MKKENNWLAEETGPSEQDTKSINMKSFEAQSDSQEEEKKECEIDSEAPLSFYYGNYCFADEPTSNSEEACKVQQ